MEKAFWAIVIIAAVIIAALVGAVAVGKQEKKECAQWAQQADEYPGFYYTSWQKEQCGIK